MIREMISSVFTVIVALAVGFYLLDQIAGLYGEYQKIRAMLEDDAYIRNKCRDPIFFSEIRRHTDICMSIENNAKIGAFMLALKNVTSNALQFEDIAQFMKNASWPFLGTLAIACLVCPSLLITGTQSLSGSCRRREIPMYNLENGGPLKSI